MEEEGEEEKQKATGDNQAESSEPAAVELGTSSGSARFYDCVYCKRGFTTAQALGGHMNMHRHDRARLRPTGLSSSSPTRKSEEAYHPYARAQRPPPKQSVEESSSSYKVYFPAASSEEGSQRATELVQAGEELQLGLGGSGPMEEKEEKKKEVVEEDLDLELRLGPSKSQESSSDS